MFGLFKKVGDPRHPELCVSFGPVTVKELSVLAGGLEIFQRHTADIRGVEADNVRLDLQVIDDDEMMLAMGRLMDGERRVPLEIRVEHAHGFYLALGGLVSLCRKDGGPEAGVIAAVAEAAIVTYRKDAERFGGVGALRAKWYRTLPEAAPAAS